MANIDINTGGVSPKSSPDNLKPDLAKVRSSLIEVSNRLADLRGGVNVLVTIGEHADAEHLGVGWIAGQLHDQIANIRIEIDDLLDVTDPGGCEFIKDVMRCGDAPAAGAA